jgi:catenin alpha
MSNNEDGVKMVRTAAAQIENLCPQVINAARVLAVRPRSKLALDNMDVFRDAWQAQVRLLTEAVDDITTIDDFLAVSGITNLTYLIFMYLYNMILNFRKSYIGGCQ